MSKLDDLEHTTDNLKKMLKKALEHRLVHKELADWCYEYWNSEEQLEKSRYKGDKGLKVAEEIDTQWELYLINTYSLTELQKLDVSKIQIPREWLQDWLNSLD
ncbi:hypothetical protein RCG23_14025 [Neobacillus sp. PS3-34]|uniref:hypothetical protein n=1 Tax=Neobacillus sp. PS3-34 TaxID=3070678 RepID=UPI0027DF3843|nr:hypothetical protein [Neobacillus sp. PS3-34]WML46758.1 hypothetical protein RCG23_14025 [Neobacillus sp. PS3-34]